VPNEAAEQEKWKKDDPTPKRQGAVGTLTEQTMRSAEVSNAEEQEVAPKPNEHRAE
jgi:hypothetical protein